MSDVEFRYRVEHSQPPESVTIVSARATYAVEGAIRHEYAEIILRWDATREEIEAAKRRLAETHRPLRPSASERTPA